MKIVFMGTPDFAVPILDAIDRAGHEILLVVTQPDRAKGRGGAISAPPAKGWADAHSIPVFQPVRIREPLAAERVADIDADICVVAAFGQILPRELLEWPRYGCVNVHASLLPRYRGAAPIQWAILNGDETTGVTIQQMAEGVDTGDILLQKETHIGERETGGELFDRLAVLGGEAVAEALSAIEAGTITRTPQDESLATHVGMIDKSLGRIDWSRPAAEIERYVRGLNPWPGTYTQLGGKTLKLWAADVVAAGDNADMTSIDGAACGTVVSCDSSRLVVACGEDALSLTELQLEGKKRLAVSDFLRGCRIDAGTVMG